MAEHPLEPAEIARLEAESRKFEAEARKAQAEAENAELTAEVNRIIRDQTIEARAASLATDSRHHVYRFNGAVADASVKACMTKLSEWMRQEPMPTHIEIIFSSNGGSIIDGLALYDFIQQVKAQGIHVTTTALGVAASMAGILLQAGHTRVMTKGAFLLIHEASFGAGGSYGQVEDTMEFVGLLQDHLLDILAERSTMSKAQIRKRWSRRDWWMGSSSALKLGLIDEVA